MLTSNTFLKLLSIKPSEGPNILEAQLKFKLEVSYSIHEKSNLVALFLVNFYHLIDKHDHIEVRGSAKQISGSNFTAGTQYVIVSKKESNIGSVTIGVPQG